MAKFNLSFLSVIADALRSLGESIKDKISELKESLGPSLKIVLLVTLIVIMLIVLIIVINSIPGSTPSQQTTTSLAQEKKTSIYGTDFELGPETEAKEYPQNIDPFLLKPILPPEPRLYLEGEIELSRPPRSAWSIEDIMPLWPSLEAELLKILRQENQKDFLRLLNEDAK